MREILFRGKRVNNGEWVYGDLLQDRDLGQMMIEYFDYYTDENGRQRDYCQYDVIPETVGQFTGLVDKNDTKIFEGDIVKVTNCDGIIDCCDCGVGKVIFHLGMWYIAGDVNNSLYILNNVFYIEVIGNIHDNKGLLEGE